MMMAERAALPDLSHLTYKDYEHVYEPAGDTYLLADALWLERNSLQQRMEGGGGSGDSILSVEIGSGTATATAVLAQCFADVGLANCAKFICTDVNPMAAAASKDTLDRNGIAGDVVMTDLAQAIRPQVDGKVDVLIFNPPYVPTPSAEVGGNGISAAWAGGCKGREVLDRLLPSVHHLLSPRGVFYLIAVDENDPEDIAAILGAYGLATSTVLQRRDRNELLMVLKIHFAASTDEGEKDPVANDTALGEEATKTAKIGELTVRRL
jgi:release factor glutamine methyltransferase